MPVKEGLSDIIVILDRSGSMKSVQMDTIESLNGFIKDQKAVPGEARFTLVQFDTRHVPGDSDGAARTRGVSWGRPVIETIRERVDLADVEDLTEADYEPHGGTPLWDACGITVTRMGKVFADLPEDERPEHVIACIVTDGYENQSQEWKLEPLQALIKDQQEKWGWDFVYLGAGVDAVEESRSLGIIADPSAANVKQFASVDGMATRGAVGMSASVAAYRTKGTERSATYAAQAVAADEAEKKAPEANGR